MSRDERGDRGSKDVRFSTGGWSVRGSRNNVGGKGSRSSRNSRSSKGYLSAG